MIGLVALVFAGIAHGAPRLRIDAPLVPAIPCEASAPPEIGEALRAGLPVPWRRARILFPDVSLERALVRRVIMRAARVGVCGGRVVAEDVTARLVGPRSMPIEVVIATTLRPGPVLGVTEADVALRPPPGSRRITARDTFTAYGVWDLGAALPAPPSSGASSEPAPTVPAPSSPSSR